MGMTDELHDMSVMAQSERLKELADQADDQLADLERKDREREWADEEEKWERLQEKL